MKAKLTTIIFLFFVLTSSAQVLTNAKVVLRDEYYSKLADSLNQSIIQKNSIVIEGCPIGQILYIVEEINSWKGIFMQKVFTKKSEDSYTNTINEPRKTKIVYFEADSLVALLKEKGIYQISQLSQDSLQSLYTEKQKSMLNNRQLKSKRTIVYGLPFCSHVNDMSIEVVQNRDFLKATYSNCLFLSDELQFISQIQIFGNIDSVLKKVYKDYE